jgi:hypothetical protein
VHARRWLTIPNLDGSREGSLVTGRSGTAAGGDLVVFGGVRWGGWDWLLLDEAWRWSPPA